MLLIIDVCFLPVDALAPQSADGKMHLPLTRVKQGKMTPFAAAIMQPNMMMALSAGVAKRNSSRYLTVSDLLGLPRFCCAAPAPASGDLPAASASSTLSEAISTIQRVLNCGG